jgi:hypothetical protein
MWALAAVSAVTMAALAGGIAFGGKATCTNAGTLNGSAFELDANANQTVEGPVSGCKDWLNTGPGTGPIIKQDSPSGSGDESFGEGTKEDTALPTVVSGSIPPNKSDLKAFGVYTETGEIKPGNPTGKFLDLLWTRVQDPSGTTNMDFELNQKFCDGTAAYTNTVNVSGNGNYGSGNFTPTAAGTYRWTADYSGDDNNQAALSPCNAPNESSVVNKAAANIETAQKLFPQDSATLSANAGGTPTGTVDFALYGPNDANCSGTPAYTENNVMLDNGTANTDNTDFSVNAAGSGNYKWVVTYSGDDTHDGATSACGKEAFTATIDNDTSN